MHVLKIHITLQIDLHDAWLVPLKYCVLNKTRQVYFIFSHGIYSSITLIVIVSSKLEHVTYSDSNLFYIF